MRLLCAIRFQTLASGLLFIFVQFFFRSGMALDTHIQTRPVLSDLLLHTHSTTSLYY